MPPPSLTRDLRIIRNTLNIQPATLQMQHMKKFMLYIKSVKPELLHSRFLLNLPQKSGSSMRTVSELLLILTNSLLWLTLQMRQLLHLKDWQRRNLSLHRQKPHKQRLMSQDFLASYGILVKQHFIIHKHSHCLIRDLNTKK